MEEKKEKPNKKCSYCDFYDRYYTKGLHRFERTKQGFCSKQKKIVASTNAASVGGQTAKDFSIAKKSRRAHYLK